MWSTSAKHFEATRRRQTHTPVINRRSHLEFLLQSSQRLLLASTKRIRIPSLVGGFLVQLVTLYSIISGNGQGIEKFMILYMARNIIARCAIYRWILLVASICTSV